MQVRLLLAGKPAAALDGFERCTREAPSQRCWLRSAEAYPGQGRVRHSNKGHAVEESRERLYVRAAQRYFAQACLELYRQSVEVLSWLRGRWVVEGSSCTCISAGNGRTSLGLDHQNEVCRSFVRTRYWLPPGRRQLGKSLFPVPGVFQPKGFFCFGGSCERLYPSFHLRRRSCSRTLCRILIRPILICSPQSCILQARSYFSTQSGVCARRRGLRRRPSVATRCT